MDAERREPRNRTPEPLPVLRIEIVHASGTLALDPNSAAMLAATGDYPFGGPVPGLRSCLSNKKAYLLREDDLEIPLAFDELDRYLRRDLTPREYFALLDRHGMFYSIHEDFYIEEDGKCWQPMERGEKFPQTAARLRALAEADKLQKAVPAAAPKKSKPF